MLKIAGGWVSVSLHMLEINWQKECCQSCNLTRPAVLQKCPDRAASSLKGHRSELQVLTNPFSRQQKGTVLVKHMDEQVEWKINTDSWTGNGCGVKRVKPRMGNIFPVNQYKGPLVDTGKNLAHKLSGMACSYTNTENVCKGQERLNLYSS